MIPKRSIADPPRTDNRRTLFQPILNAQWPGRICRFQELTPSHPRSRRSEESRWHFRQCAGNVPQRRNAPKLSPIDGDQPMEMRKLGRTGLSIAPIVFGGNVLRLDGRRENLLCHPGCIFRGRLECHRYGRRLFVLGSRQQGRGFRRNHRQVVEAKPHARDRAVIVTKVGSDMGQGQTAESGLYPESGRGFAAPATDRLYRPLSFALA